MVSIAVNGHSITAESQQPGGDHFVNDAAHSNYILVHCSHALEPAEYERLSQLGVEVLTYHATNTYSCRFEPTDLQEIRDLPFVEFANVFADKLCVSPAQREALTPNVQAAVKARPSEAHLQATSGLADPHDELRWFYLFLHDEGRAHQAVAAVSNVPSVEKDTIVDEKYGILRVRFMVRDLDAVARVDDVAYVQKVGRCAIANWRARSVIGLDSLDATIRPHRDKINEQLSLQTLGAKIRGIRHHLRGAGQTVVVADSGFDIGSASVVGSTTHVHPAFTGRVLKVWDYTNTGFEDENGHGTHVAGSVLACAVDAAGVQIDGTAPAANLISHKVANASGNQVIIGDRNKIFTDDMEDRKNARVHNNSYGDLLEETSLGQIEYNALAKTVDTIAYQHQDWIIVYAAGNDGERMPGPTLGGVAAAKNVITVGSCENTHRLEHRATNPNNRYNSAYPPGSPNTVPLSSNRGPVRNTQRRKPDVLAPGRVVYSARSRMPDLGSVFSEVNGARHYDYDKHGLSADPLYWYMDGTSMAAPLVSGCCAGLRNVYASVKGMWPSSAMVKALLAIGAVDVSGVHGTSNGGPAPNNTQGFGRVNITWSLRPLFISGGGSYDSWGQAKKDAAALAMSESKRFVVRVKDSGRTLVAALAFVDRPALDLSNYFALVVETMERKVVKRAELRDDNNLQRVAVQGIVPGYYNVVVTRERGDPFHRGEAGHFAVCWDLR